MLERFDIDNAALRLLGRIDGCLVQRLGVLLEHLVGHVGDFALRFHRFLRMADAKRQNNLILPQRNRIHQCRLDLLRHQLIIVLDQADLRRHLD